MSAYQTLKDGLLRLGLENVPGSIFDNAFNVFERDRNTINLVVVGTNGNSSDRKHSTLDWLDKRANTPHYSHLKQGDWGRTPLQSRLTKIPQCLNEAFNCERFSEESTLYTNALLLASSGVDDIDNCVKLLDTSVTKFRRKEDIINASMMFFMGCTLSLANPDVLVVYGNTEPGNSAWAYIRQHCRVVGGNYTIPLYGSASYKFCSIHTGEKVVPVIGCPHLSRFKLSPPHVQQGLAKLGAFPCAIPS